MLFKHGPRSKEDRIQLRCEMQKSPIGDAQRLTQELESLYQKLRKHIPEPLR